MKINSGRFKYRKLEIPESARPTTEKVREAVFSMLLARLVMDGKTNINKVYDPTCGSRVIIMTEANSSVKSKVLKLLPKLKTEETDSLCVA